MGFFRVLGSAGKFVGGALLEEINSQIKQNTGIDFAKELKEQKRELDELKEEREKLEKSKEDFIKLYGEEAYQEEYSLYQEEINFVKKAIFEDARCLAYEGKENLREEYICKVENLSDKQLLRLKNRNNLPEFLERIVYEEINYRGL